MFCLGNCLEAIVLNTNNRLLSFCGIRVMVAGIKGEYLSHKLLTYGASLKSCSR